MDKTIRPEKVDNTQNDQSPELLRVIESVSLRNVTETIAVLQLIQRSIGLPPELFDAVRRAELSNRSLASKISALIELYGGKEAQVPLRIACYDVRQFFTVLTEQINTALGHKMKGDVSFEMDEFEEMNASFDARRVCMILYHLVANALQHGTTEDKNVILRPCGDNRVFEISVRDYGGGIPKERQATMFTAFAEALSIQALTKGPFPPRIQGIGLPLCRKLAKDMDGELTFKNYKTGAKFMLVIPQQKHRIREVSVFYPDDTLMQACMADLLGEIMEEEL